MRTTTRKILAYTLDITVPRHEIDEDSLNDIFNYLVNQFETGEENEKLIYNRQGGDKDTFIVNVIDENSITGKIIRVRSDLWPQVIDMATAELRDLELPDNNEVIESSHFQIRKENNYYKLLFEYNHYGAKVSHFIDLLQVVGGNVFSFISSTVLPIQLEFSEFIDDLSSISELSVEIKKDNISRIENSDIIDSLIAASRAFDTSIINLKWTLDESLFESAKQFLRGIFNITGETPYSKVKVYSKKQGTRLQWFDMLEIRSSFQVKPELRSKRVLNSTDMFKKIRDIDL